MYAFTWCNHSRIHLVLVSFPAKESDNLALMVGLVEPPLGALPMAPKPFFMWFINLVVS